MPDPASAPGRTIAGRFRVERILGRGGMGEVVLAHDTLLNRRVALKRIRAGDAPDAERREAILREARRASQVGDPRIATIHDVLDLGGDVLIVMEYVDGATLRERMSQPLPVAEFWDLATQCLEAVGAAHAHGVIHRDIKPENLMVTREGRVKILDFGIARRAETVEGTPSAVTTTATLEGRAPAIAGTPQYMAPEAHYGGRIDARTDLFSLGTVFYELLTGRNPFAAPTYEAVLERVMNASPEPAETLNAEIGSGLSSVIARMMAKDAARRYGSCEEVTRDLVGLRQVGGALPAAASATRATTTSRRRVLGWNAAAAVLVLLAATAAGWGLWRRSAAALPAEQHLAVLAPLAPGASEDFAAFALGAADLLAARLQRHQDRAGFQLASFQETFDEEISTPDEARRVQGANLALRSSLEQGTDGFRARLELWDTRKNRVLATRAFETPLPRPHEFLDRLYREATGMLGLPAGGGDVTAATGVRGAGTLRFLLQGVGRVRTAATEAEARRAVDDIELACRAEPDAALARAWRSAAERKCFNLGQDRAWLGRAEASAREAVERDSGRAEAYRSLGHALAERREREGALAAYRRSVELNPTDDATVLRLARTHAHLGRPERERETYLAAIAARPHCWQPYWWLATWEFREGRIEEAAAAFRGMIRRSPDLYRGYSSLGGLLVLTGDYDRAVDTLKASIALRPSEVAFDNLGTAYFNSGRLEEAVDAYNQAFQFGFASYVMWLNLGDAYHWLPGRRERALEAYGEAVRLGREEMAKRAREARAPDPMVPALLAAVFPRLGQADSARTYLALALRADSTNSRVQHSAALTWWQLGERDRAVEWLARAVRGGYPVAWLRDSPMFEEWRAEESFRALIAGAGPPKRHPTPPAGGGRT